MKSQHFNLVIATAIILATLTGCTNSAKQKKSASEFELPSRGLCAHRGTMITHPENTLLAFREAVNAGAHMVELDVWLTKDNEMVVIHDSKVDRTTDGTGLVSDLTLAEIKQLDAGSWKSPEFTGERIPTFEEALGVMPVNIWLNIHLKGEGLLPVMVAQMIAKENRLHQAFLACSQAAANKAREAVPGIMICNMERQESDWDYVNATIEMKADFIQLRRSMNPEYAEYTKALKEHGIHVNYFGTDDPEVIKTLFDYGVDFPLVNDIINTMRVAEELGIPPVVPVFNKKQ